jgi:sRNA-binding carbon storage regulator CsrA
MLSIGRRAGESIEITHGGEKITVYWMKSGLVVDGPRGFHIRRSELGKSKKTDNGQRETKGKPAG